MFTWKLSADQDKGHFWLTPSTCQQAVKHLSLRAPKQTQQNLHWFLTCSDWANLTKFLRRSPFSQPQKHYSDSLQQSWQLKRRNFKNTLSIVYLMLGRRRKVLQYSKAVPPRKPSLAAGTRVKQQLLVGGSSHNLFHITYQRKGNLKKPTWSQSFPSWGNRGMPTTQPLEMIHRTFYE